MPTESVVVEKVLTREQFEAQACAELGMPIERVVRIGVSRDGQQVHIGLLPKDLVVEGVVSLGAYVLDGGYAFDSFLLSDNVLVVGGTAKLLGNTATNSVLAWLKHLLGAADRREIFFSKPPEKIRHYMIHPSRGLAVPFSRQVTYVPQCEAFVTCGIGSSSLLWLPRECAERADMGPTDWRASNPVASCMTVCGLPLRVPDASRVLVKTDRGQALLDLTRLRRNRVETYASEVNLVNGITFRGWMMVGGRWVAVVEAEHAKGQLAVGTNLVTREQLAAVLAPEIQSWLPEPRTDPARD